MAPLTQFGRDLIGRQIFGDATSSQDWNAANSWIHVGSSTVAFASSQNSLLGAVTAQKAMNGGFPTYSVTSGGAPVLQYQSTFTTSEAVFEWAEWMVKNSSATATSTSSGVALNRKMESPTLGIKPNTQSWQFTASISVTT
jgi:hypothetical protein